MTFSSALKSRRRWKNWKTNPNSRLRSRACSQSGERGQVAPSSKHLAGGGRVEQAEDVQQGALARAGGADDDEEFPAPHLEVDAAQDRERRAALGILLHEVAGDEEAGGRLTHSAAPPPGRAAPPSPPGTRSPAG